MTLVMYLEFVGTTLEEVWEARLVLDRWRLRWLPAASMSQAPTSCGEPCRRDDRRTPSIAYRAEPTRCT
jgi:hypothetical protein